MTLKEQVVDRTVLATALEMSLPDRRDVLLLDYLKELFLQPGMVKGNSKGQ